MVRQLTDTRQNRVYRFILRRIYIRRYKYFTPTELLEKETDKHYELNQKPQDILGVFWKQGRLFLI